MGKPHLDINLKLN